MREFVPRGAAPPALAAAVWLVLLAATLHAAPAAAGADVQVLAHGSGERYWLARVFADPQRGGAFVTDVYGRLAGESTWHQLARVEGRAAQLANRGEQVALLLDGGGWLLVSDETVATGRPPPGVARLLSLATWGDSFLGLARVYDPQRAAPSPAVAGSTRAATDSERLVLLSLTPGGWVDAGGFDVEGPLPGTPGDASLAVVEGAALVAVRDGLKSVGVYRQSDGSRRRLATVETASPLASFKLVGGPVPVLWTVESDGATRLHWLGKGAARSVNVDAPAAADAARVPAAAAYAIERIRVVSGAGLILSERSFDALIGAPVGGATPLKLPRPPLPPPLFQWAEPLLTVLLLFTIVASLRRRGEMQEAMRAANPLPLAPFGRRLIAGTIDAAPVFASMLVLYVWERRAEDAGEPMLGARSQLVALAGLLAYLLHTTASELVFGRTIGKACCGLRVAALDGSRPSASALLTRNVLRLIDLSMMFFPLVLVLYSPLRQRAGDVAAGTLVVLDKPLDEPTAEEAESTGSAQSQSEQKAREPAEMAK